MVRDGGRKVGELAAATGLTVRTLHYYEQIGILAAAARSSGGHRLYSADDVARLYQILLLRRLGFTLADIATSLDDPAWNLRAALERDLLELDARLSTGQELRRRVAGLRHGEATDGEQELLAVIEGMAMLDTTMHRYAAARGADVVYEPVDQPYGYREYSARDPEGGLWSFMKELT